MSTMKKIAILLAALWIMTGCTGPYYLDDSLSLEEYYKLGIPQVTREWKFEDHEKALNILEKLRKDKRLSLPRYGSERSGKLFDKMHDFPNVMNLAKEFESDGSNLERLGTELTTLEQLQRRNVELYVERDQNKVGFGKEIVMLALGSMKVDSAILPLTDSSLKLVATVARRTDAQAMLEEIRTPIKNKLSQMFVFYKEPGKFEQEDILLYTQSLKTYLPLVMHLIDMGDRNLLLAKVAGARGAVPGGKVKEELEQVHKVVEKNMNMPVMEDILKQYKSAYDSYSPEMKALFDQNMRESMGK